MTSHAASADPVALGPDHPLVVPVRLSSDLDRIGPVAEWFAALYDAPIDIVCIRNPDDDNRADFELISEQIDRWHAMTKRPLRLRYVIDEELPEEFFDTCTDQVVCMATSASPFRDRHYVGSFAVALMRRTNQPALLVGPNGSLPAQAFAGVTAAVGPDGSCGVLHAARDVAERLEVPLRHITIEAETGSVSTTTFPAENDGLPERVELELHAEPVAADQLDEALAVEAGPSLLAVATRGKGDLAWIADGSVAFDLLASATTPVLVTGPSVGERPVPRVRDDGPGARLVVELDATTAATARIELDRRVLSVDRPQGARPVEVVFRPG